MPPATGFTKVAANSFAAIVHAFLNSPKFLGYAPSTQKLWGAELRYVATHDFAPLSVILSPKPGSKRSK